MSEPTKAVFLSYASQDKEVAKRICDALRAAGVEVWFDQSELRGGDAWDALIRKRIKECALFVPIITPTTNARAEGYFRLEWKLAVDRSHLMAEDAPFLFPIAVGDVNDATARVPDKFREVQWTRLRLDETPAELGARVAKLLGGSETVGAALRRDGSGESGRKAPPTGRQSPRFHWWMIFPIAGVSIGLLFAFGPLWKALNGSPRKAASTAQAPAETKSSSASAAPMSAPSQAVALARKAREMVEAIDSTADDYAAAEDLVKRALSLDSTDAEIWAVSSRINSGYLSRGFDRAPSRREAARTQAERAVKLAPDLAEGWLALGRAVIQADPVRSEEALRRGLSLAPKDGRILLAMGSMFRLQNRFDEAMAVYDQAAALPDSRALALYDQYLIHFYSRRFADADRCLRESIALSRSGNMVAGLAWLEVTWHGDIAAALRELAAATPAVRGQPRVVLANALISMMDHRPDDALQAFDLLPADYINDAWYTGPKGLLVGLAREQAGKTEGARIAWEEGLAVTRRRLQEAPNDPEIHLRYGELLARTGQAEAALQEVRIFNELQRGRFVDWTYSPVRIYAALGRADEALPLLEQLLTLPASHRWPFTGALLRLDPLWDKVRGDPRVQKLIADAEARELASRPPRDWPKKPELKRAIGLLDRMDNIPEDFRLAEEMAQRAVDKDPTDAEAVTALARVHSMWLLRGWDRSTARYQKAKAAAERALQLAPDEPEAHVALAIQLYARGAEAQRALALAQRAVDLYPQEARFHRIRDNCFWVLSVAPGSVFLENTPEPENEGLRKALASARRTVELFPKDPLVRYELARHYRDVGRWSDFERVTDETLALAPVANALVWKARGRFGLHGDLPGMKVVLDQVPARVRGIERTVFGYFLYAAFTGNTADGLEALNSMTESWMIDFDYRGPKALLSAALLELAGKRELARVQYTAALDELMRGRALNPEDGQTYLNEAWIKYALGRNEEARAAIRIYNETLARPYTISPMSTWWFQAIPANLLMGDRATALTFMREAVDTFPDARPTIRSRLALDPRMAAFRDDSEIKALLAEPGAKKP